MSYSLMEAKRIKEIAVSNYKPGMRVRATFKNASLTVEIRYVNPQDIPLTIDRYYHKLYLWSVHRADE